MDDIMERIYKEHPEHWPYGLNMDMFKSGSVWKVKTPEGDVAGFVGWQRTEQNGRSVGYYSVGILPEHRNNGYAKEALRQMLHKQASTVDEVRGAFVPSNEASLALNTSLACMHKDASAKEKAGLTALTALIGAITGGPGFEYAIDGQGKGLTETLSETWNDPARKHRMLTNVGLGALAGGLGAHSPSAGIMGMLAIPTKDLVFTANSKLHGLDPSKLQDAATKIADNSAPVEQPTWVDKIPKSVGYAAGVGGLGLLGLAGLSAWQKYRAEKAQEEATRGGRLTVTLPTKKVGDAETQVNIPLDSFSNAQILRLRRDVKRHVYQETRERTKRRKPADPAHMTELERADAELDAEARALDEEEANLRKESSFCALTRMVKGAAAVNNFPTPPQQGTNPAFAMQQQQQAMNAQPSRTQGNPDIAAAQQQAQQEVQAAQQQAQQELAQTQQQSQAAQQQMQMDMQAMQQDMQTDIEKAKTENEILKLKLAESEARANAKDHFQKLKSELDKERRELDAAKSESAPTPVDGGPAAVLIDQRIASIAKQLSKAASFGLTPPPPVGPQPTTPQPTTKPVLAPSAASPPTVGYMKPGTINDINANSHRYAGQMGLHRQLHVSSGSPLLDMLANTGREWLHRPNQNYIPNMNAESVEAATASDILVNPSLAGYYYDRFMNAPAQR